MILRSFLPVPVLQTPQVVHARPAGDPAYQPVALTPAPDPLSPSERRYVYTLMGLYAVTFGVTSFFAYRAVQQLCTAPAPKKTKRSR